MSRAGQYRHRVDIEDWLEVRDPETGAFTETWVTVFANVPARIAPSSGREFLAAEAIQSEIIARIVIRYRPGLNPKQRILHNGGIYNVHAWLPDQDSGRDYVSAPVSLGVPVYNENTFPTNAVLSGAAYVMSGANFVVSGE